MKIIKIKESKTVQINKFSKSSLKEFLNNYDFNILGIRGYVVVNNYDNYIKFEVYFDNQINFPWFEGEYIKEDDLLIVNFINNDRVLIEIIKIILKGRR